MIIYFADRQMNILGNASTSLPGGYTLSEDKKVADVDSGVSSFECRIHFDNASRKKVENFAKVGNYILRNHKNENEFYTIIETELSTDSQDIYIYAEDAGLDLINDIAGEDKFDEEHDIAYYVNKYAYDSGFKIKTNEIKNRTRKLSFDSETTVTARIAEIAAAFDCEISYSFKIKGLKIVNKYINIHEERGKDNPVQLRLNREVNSITVSKTIENVATALKAEGGTPDNADEAITLEGYSYDDGDFYIDGDVLYSRKALKKWSRYVWEDEPNQILGNNGHIVKYFSSDALTQAQLCEEAKAELKKVQECEVNYEADVNELPENVKIGDRINIIDRNGELYLSTRILQLETSVTDQKTSAVFGEYIIKKSGISSKVQKLAKDFAKTTVSVKRAKEIANEAKKEATTALAQANSAAEQASEVLGVAQDAQQQATDAANSAAQALGEAQAAKADIEKIEQSVSSMEQTVNNAQQTAQNAQQAAQTADQKAEEAKTAAENAEQAAQEAQNSADEAQNSADSALSNAENAKNTAETAKKTAESAQAEAIAAKLDAKKAESDVNDLENTLESVSDTMKTDYARKTELTETTAELQTQINRNAAGLESAAHRMLIIDETANNALTKLEAAQQAAALAQEQADLASADATAAQQAANEAKEAANTAKAEAETAKAAYETAKAVVDRAEADLLAAQKDLATIEARADATAEEIAAAQAAVNSAQITVDNARTEADNAAQTAENAQNAAIEAVNVANSAQIAANNAVIKANLAQATADEAKGNATEAQRIASEAQAIADAAKATADAARADADNAQAIANEAAEIAAQAQADVDTADAALQQANIDLAEAQTRLDDVLANAEATQTEIDEAQAALDNAQIAVNDAQTAAENAENAFIAANEDAIEAQTAADEAKAEADEAQEAATEAQRAADEAQGYVYALEKRATETETKIKQNSEEISLAATKEEVRKTLGGYTTTEELEAAIKVKADEIALSVKSVEETQEGDKKRIADLEAKIQVLENSISSLIVGEDGTSYMEQTENGWSFNIGALQKDIEGLTEELNIINSSVQIYETPSGQPIIELKVLNKDGETFAFKAQVTNTGIFFYDEGSLPASISDGALNIEKAIVKQELRHTIESYTVESGAFVWKVRSNGNLCLDWEKWW